jgi:type II protein arginine methyltransferase
MSEKSEPQIERMIEAFESALKERPDYPIGIIGLAELVAIKKQRFRAFELCRKALAIGAGDAEVAIRARRLMSSLVRGYHVGMMNDLRRNAAWNKALTHSIRAGMRALEIGTGGGMLALMAARAGAGKVTTCERDPILANIAREIIERNGLTDRIEVIAKPSEELLPGRDIEAPADLLFCDIFGDSLLDFGPLAALTDARRRLTTPDAVVVPAAGAIRLALADWRSYPILGHVDHAAGFDITSFANFVPASVRVLIGDRSIFLRSDGTEALRFHFATLSQPALGKSEVILTAKEDAVVNGIIHWIRLELDAETILEARPEPGAVFFSSPHFWPLAEPLSMRRGDTLRVGIAHDQKRLTIWPTE